MHAQPFDSAVQVDATVPGIHLQAGARGHELCVAEAHEALDHGPPLRLLKDAGDARGEGGGVGREGECWRGGPHAVRGAGGWLACGGMLACNRRGSVVNTDETCGDNTRWCFNG